MYIGNPSFTRAPVCSCIRPTKGKKESRTGENQNKRGE